VHDDAAGDHAVTGFVWVWFGRVRYEHGKDGNVVLWYVEEGDSYEGLGGSYMWQAGPGSCLRDGSGQEVRLRQRQHWADALGAKELKAHLVRRGADVAKVRKKVDLLSLLKGGGFGTGWVGNLKVKELQEELGRAGQDTDGKKAVLAARLCQALAV